VLHSKRIKGNPTFGMLRVAFMRHKKQGGSRSVGDLSHGRDPSLVPQKRDSARDANGWGRLTTGPCRIGFVRHKDD